MFGALNTSFVLYITVFLMGELAPPNGRTCRGVGQVRPAAAIVFTARFCQNRVHVLGENRILGRYYLGLYTR